MLTTRTVVPLTALLCCAGMLSCVSVGNQDIKATAHTYDKPYEEVRQALETLIFEDLKCVPRKIVEDKGYIETEWVHRIDTDGTTRWRIRSQIKKKKEGVWVVINKEVQTKDEVKKNMDRFRQEKNQDTAGGESGWKSQKIGPQPVQDLYQRLSDKLEP